MTITVKLADQSYVNIKSILCKHVSKYVAVCVCGCSYITCL